MKSGFQREAGASATIARRRVGELVGGADDELVEGVAGDQVRRGEPERASASAAPALRRGPGRGADGGHRYRSLAGGGLVGDLEVDDERALRARFEVPQDRRQEIILEPLLVIAVRRAQADAPVVDSDALDGAQPEITVGRLHHRLDGAHGLGPELIHIGEPIHRCGRDETTILTSTFTELSPLYQQPTANCFQPRAVALGGERESSSMQTLTESRKRSVCLSDRSEAHQGPNRGGG